MPPRKMLTGRERSFVREYLVDRSSRAAALRAGYSARSAAKAYAVMKRRHVKAAIDAALVEQARMEAVTPGRVLAELARIAFADFSNEGRPPPDGGTAAATDGSAGRAPQGIRVTPAEKLRSLELIGKALGMFGGPGAGGTVGRKPGASGGTQEKEGGEHGHRRLSDLELAQRLLYLAVRDGKGSGGARGADGDRAVAADGGSGQAGTSDAAGAGAGKRGG